MNTPDYLKKRIFFDPELLRTKRVLKELAVGTVCESSFCPNLNECFAGRQATFLILGDACTRSCAFCAIRKARPPPPDPHEGERVIEAVRRLGLRYAVITSVTRDDLDDGGAGAFASLVRALKDNFAKIKVEVLVPDFSGRSSSVEEVLGAGPDVFGHNVETVERLYGRVRSGADYRRSLWLLKTAKEISGVQITKSGIMLGLGETEAEVVGVLRDIRETGCDILTIGQYLRPGAGSLAVDRFVTPAEFENYKGISVELGFKYCAAGPFVRSSYLAEEIYCEAKGELYEGCHAAAAG